jgi:hypothetical protein
MAASGGTCGEANTWFDMMSMGSGFSSDTIVVYN